ncbi:phosphoribosylanthranilate isomerase [Barrientosiimonas marina]|uniref:N-(5'-phosphoribosyl)anthranilate isomerase n=1 Tax=Lentibacillus kimchii TaxID=1542911 RepID=A0ABW2UU91_9BACI
MHVKICGITTSAAAQEALRAGADFLGFVFAPSKRQLTPEQAARITADLPPSLAKVGVFVNASRDTIMTTAEQAGLDMIQLHGDEPPSFAASLPYPVIKAFRLREQHPETIKRYPCTYNLIDSPTGPGRGGNGTTFDWKQLADSSLDPHKTILAGGLTPENVHAAITAAGPAAVDVSSGVETDGTKDLAKINQFIQNAKQKG